MKKPYSKPTLQVIPFALNEAIASCGAKLHNNHQHDDCGDTELGMVFEGLGVNFAIDKADCTIPINDYCYYTSMEANGVNLFNS